MLVVEPGTEADLGMGPVKQANKGGSAFQDKFKVKQSGKTAQTPTQVWTDKYEILLKSNGWGGSGRKCPRNWGERETDTVELESILGRIYLTQLVVKKKMWWRGSR